MSRAVGHRLLTRSIKWQAVAIAALWILLGVYVWLNPQSSWDPKVSIALLAAVPAAVIGVAQLLVSSHIQRAAYIKDYALRFRTDKELSESFHYLIYLFGNTKYEAYLKGAGSQTQQQATDLARSQEGIAADLRFFNPRAAIGAPQERRLDNLLGFFDTLGYDFRRGLLEIRDIAGVFGYYLDHLIQRKVVQDYLSFVEEQWPKANSFHQQYSAPVPFLYLRSLIRAYIDLRTAQNKQQDRST
jgi:hypothetical protein